MKRRLSSSALVLYIISVGVILIGMQVADFTIVIVIVGVGVIVFIINLRSSTTTYVDFYWMISRL